MKGGWYFRRRLGMKAGWRRSGFVETTWSMLLRDLRRSTSFGGGGGRDRDEEPRMWSFSMGVGGLSRSGVEPDSGSLGISPTVYS